MTEALHVAFTDDMTLRDARDELRRRVDDGHRCPLCTQMARVYRRKLTRVAARALAALYREHGTDYGHMPTVARKHLADVHGQGGYLVLGAHWALMQDETTIRREDGGRAGYWRVTPLGVDWLTGRTRVPMYARIYDGRCLGLTGDLVGIEDVGGFDLAELLRPAPAAPVLPGAAGQAELFPTEQQQIRDAIYGRTA
jgi:hypothetical protein